jgi:hypothetical protein
VVKSGPERVQRRRDGFDILSGIQGIFRNCSAALKPDAFSRRMSV